VYWIHEVQNRGQCRPCERSNGSSSSVSATDFLISYKSMLASKERLCSRELFGCMLRYLFFDWIII
jgi:hypothetical protein